MAAPAKIVTAMTEGSSLPDGVKRLRLVAIFAEENLVHAHTTLPPKVSESPCRPKGYECSLNSVQTFDGRCSHPGGLERRKDHRHLNVRQVLLQLAASTRTPRSRWRRRPFPFRI